MNVNELDVDTFAKLTGSQLGMFDIIASLSGTSLIEVASPSIFNFAAKTIVGNFNIQGSSGNDTLHGKNMTINGNGGDDSYHFNAGDGHLTIVNGIIGDNKPTGSIVLGGYDTKDFMVTRSGNDLEVKFTDSTDRITITDWFTNNYNQVQSITTASGSINNSLINSISAKDAVISSYINGTLDPNDATIIGTNNNFLNFGEEDKIIRMSSGEVGVVMFGDSHKYIGRIWLYKE